MPTVHPLVFSARENANSGQGICLCFFILEHIKFQYYKPFEQHESFPFPNQWGRAISAFLQLEASVTRKMFAASTYMSALSWQ